MYINKYVLTKCTYMYIHVHTYVCTLVNGTYIAPCLPPAGGGAAGPLSGAGAAEADVHAGRPPADQTGGQ